MTKNIKIMMISPTTLIALKTGSGHLSHSYIPTLIYLFSFTKTHDVHKIPEYPVAHIEGFSTVPIEPPTHESFLGHLMISEELRSLLQYPGLTSISVPPSQTALSIHFIHSVEFQRRE